MTRASWMYDDINDQLAEQAQAERGEYADIAADARRDALDDRPSKADADHMRYLDDLDERRARGR